MIKKDGGKTSRGGGVGTANHGAQDARRAGKVSAGPSARKNAKATPQAAAVRRSAKEKPKAPLPPIAALGIEKPREGPGRPPEYRPEFVRVAHAMAKLGGTDFEIAEELGVSTFTIWNWRSKYPEFSNALLEGKEAFDNRIERSLAQRAAGYSYHSEKIFISDGQPIRVPIVEHVAPDIGAIKLWLGNRRPDQWRDKSEVKLDSSDAFLACWRAISEGTA